MGVEHETYGLSSETRDRHVVVIEKMSGVVACGDGWCDGSCGWPALTISFPEVNSDPKRLRAMGSQVAMGMVFQPFRGMWNGEVVEASLSGSQLSDVLRMMWW